MVRKFLIVLTLIGFLAGLAVFLYPHISSWLIESEVNQAVGEFKTARGLVELKQQDKLYQAMDDYNQSLHATGQAKISDAWTFEQQEFTLNNYDYKNDVVAMISIPKMNLKMPIYLGATKQNMAKGIVNLGNTSVPIGGKNTNCVLAGHRGYRGAPFFRDIEDLKIGDEIVIDNLWEQLSYKVSKISVIYPTDSNQVLIQEDRDMVTLITCHPYRNNYQRYVVYCSRSDEFDKSLVDKEDIEIVSSKNDIVVEQNLPYIFLGIMGLVIIIVFIYTKRKTK